MMDTTAFGYILRFLLPAGFGSYIRQKRSPPSETEKQPDEAFASPGVNDQEPGSDFFDHRGFLIECNAVAENFLKSHYPDALHIHCL